MRYFNSVAIDGSKMALLAIESFGWADQSRVLQEAEKYELRVLETILMINQTQTGRAVFHAIERVSVASADPLSSKIMVVEPNADAPGKDPYPGANLSVNAYAAPSDLAGATPEGKVYATETYIDEKGVLRARKLRGTGVGSDTTIKFTPQHFVWKVVNLFIDATNPARKFEPDEFLLHEAVHGLRQMSGLSFQKRVPFQKGYDNIEEFFAVLIANIYRSESARKKLRKDHGKEFIDISEDEFMRKGMNRSHLRQLRRQHGQLFAELRDVNTSFNPTRRILDI